MDAGIAEGFDVRTIEYVRRSRPMIRKPEALAPVELGPEHDGIEMSIYEFDAAGAYWIVDSIKDPARPAMTVLHRKSGDEPFERRVVRAGGTYTCRRWPGIKVDLRKIAVE
jgi:hypothetical protein